MTGSVVRNGSPQGSGAQAGLALVVSAPSGGGKTAVLERVLAYQPDAVFSVSVTTRPPRRVEKPGEDYIFVTPEAFERMVASGELLEWAEVYGARYGTPRAPVLEALERGSVVLLDVDHQGARQLKAALPESVSVFLAPPSMEDLEKRLRERGTEPEEAVQGRLEAALSVIATGAAYDYFILNHDLESAARAVHAVIIAERAKTRRLGGKRFVADFCRGFGDTNQGEHL